MPDTSNLFCWNMVTAGLGMNGRGEDTVRGRAVHNMFGRSQMGHKIKPHGVTFVALLSACSHSGLKAEGWRFFTKMLLFKIQIENLP
ncbi:hypothetical protein E2562_029873 [Oryza meyeriana var. granulata]|uniref:Uncharacterized protein n=1 Tax=Oryza meyeriana var. granulata TaxID=110450 RepID=A0A6G1ER53_9ORYZ|nr:hypothetical protein E2562_029873 [Oryza meyeriana var. granulata]